MRYIGAIFVIAAFFSVGIGKAMECKKCCKTLQNSIAMLGLIKSEICTVRSPINRIMSRISVSVDGEVRQFAETVCEELKNLGEKDFCEIWHDAANGSLQALPKECLSEISQLGTSIGRYESELQAKAIDRCSTVLSAFLANYQPDVKNRQKMYIGLYGGIGMIVAVVLI